MKKEKTPCSFRFYGVRGSFPLTAPAYSGYGGNTVCAYLDWGCHVILDAGTGLRQLGREISDGPIHLLLSHLHLDHIQGLFDFPPFFEPGREIHIYAEGEAREQLRALLAPPFWPVGFDDFPASVTFHEIRADFEFWIGEKIRVRTLRSCHPGKCLAFRLTKEDRSLGYALDYELAADKMGRLEAFLRGCDAAILDGTYAPGCQIPGWGHSGWEEALAIRAGKIILSHFGDKLDDETLDAMASDSCVFAREGMTLSI